MSKVLIVTLLISMVFAVQETEKKQGVFMDLADVLQQSNLGRAIIQMSQLKAHLQGFDFGLLFTALDELTESFQSRITDENTLFSQDHDNYVSDTNFYANQVTQYDSESAQHKQDLDSLNDERGNLESTLQNKQDELYETQQLIQSLERTIANNEIVFQAQSNDYNNAISVIDQAIDLLSEVQSGDASLVQTDKVDNLSRTLGASLIALQSSRRIFFQPLVKCIAELTQSNFADQQLLRKVLGLLNDLRASLVQNKLAMTNTYQNEVAANNQILDEYNTKASSLTDIQIPQLHDTLEQVNGESTTLSAILRDAQTNLQAAQDNADATEKNWVTRTLLNRELIQEYNNELQTIAQSLTILERGGIRRQ